MARETHYSPQSWWIITSNDPRTKAPAPSTGAYYPPIFRPSSCGCLGSISVTSSSGCSHRSTGVGLPSQPDAPKRVHDYHLDLSWNAFHPSSFSSLLLSSILRLGRKARYRAGPGPVAPESPCAGGRVADLTRCWPDLTRIAVEVEKLALYAPQLAPDARTTTIFALMGALGVFVAAVIVSVGAVPRAEMRLPRWGSRAEQAFQTVASL
jgi:hypothetical protein